MKERVEKEGGKKEMITVEVKNGYGDLVRGRGGEKDGDINRDYGRRGSAALTIRHPSIRKSWH
jgi:hypothetical protein